MIEIDITDEIISLAEEKSLQMGELKNSITKGKGNIIGFIGEYLYHQKYGGEIKNTYDYDIITKDNYKVDVKTKKTSVKPLDTYYASVAALNIHQKCHFYYFVRVDIDNKKGYLLGGYNKKKFFEDAIFNKKGEEDPTSDFGWTFKEDCYNLEINKLKI